MSSVDSQSTVASSEAHSMASACAAFLSAQMKVFFEQHGILEGPERHILASDATILVLQELSPDTPKSTSHGEHDSATAEASPTTDPAAKVSAAVATTEDSTSEVASPTPSDSRSRSARIVAAHQAAIAHADESATILVTASATGHGTHTRWSYVDDPVVAVPLPAATKEELTDPPTANPCPPVETSTSDGGATLTGSSDDEGAAQEKEEAEAEAAASDPPKGRPTIIIPPSKKRVRIEEPPEAAGSSRRTRSRLSSPPPRTSVPRHTIPRDSRAPSPSPIPSHRSSSTPFNHFPKLPRSRPQGLRREPAFYHKSHYEVAWTSAFGDYDSPPKTVAEAMPEWLARASSPTPAPTQAPTPAPSPPRTVSRKRARDEETGKEEMGKGEKRPRRSSLHESK